MTGGRRDTLGQRAVITCSVAAAHGPMIAQVFDWRGGRAAQVLATVDTQIDAVTA